MVESSLFVLVLLGMLNLGGAVFMYTHRNALMPSMDANIRRHRWLYYGLDARFWLPAAIGVQAVGGVACLVGAIATGL